MPVQLSEVVQLLGAQSLAIDRGDGQGWSAIFTPDGIFDSPSYERPVTGRQDLADFAERFPRQNPGARHFVFNTHLVEEPNGTTVAHSYLMITRKRSSDSTEISRVVTTRDELTRLDGQLRISRRTVTL